MNTQSKRARGDRRPTQSPADRGSSLPVDLPSPPRCLSDAPSRLHGTSLHVYETPDKPPKHGTKKALNTTGGSDAERESGETLTSLHISQARPLLGIPSVTCQREGGGLIPSEDACGCSLPSDGPEPEGNGRRSRRWKLGAPHSPGGAPANSPLTLTVTHLSQV